MNKIIEEKIIHGARITDEECLLLFNESLPSLGRLATIAKKRQHPESVVTFVIDININITNVCTCECDFCAFYVRESEREGFVLSCDEVLAKIQKVVDCGGTQVMLQGGINPALGLDYYVSLLRAIKAHFPVYVHSFSPPEIAYLSQRESFSIKEVLTALKDAGLDSLPGGGAEILCDRVREAISPKKISADTWLLIMREAHMLGMKSTATMMFGSVETYEERIEHLHRIRTLQDETGGFRAFIPWTFSPRNTRLDHIIMAGGGEYLKMLAISRMYLDNIRNIGSGWVTEGMKVAQLGLCFGANDMGGILLEEKVLEKTGLTHTTNTDELIAIIRNAGFTAARRNTKYALCEVFA